MEALSGISWLGSLVSSATDPTVLALVAGGFVIGILAIIFGGGMFFSAPLVQWFFPGITFGAIVGNVKVGAFLRAVGSTWSTHEHVEYRRNFGISVFAFIGTLIGALLISHLDQRWVLPATILAVLVAEFGPRLAHLITNRTFHIASFLTGFYAGTFGAGIGILLVALLRLKHPADTDIAHVKIQARFVEVLLTISAVAIHWYSGNLIVAIWVPFALGSIVGGVVGGMILNRMRHLSGAAQKIVLRIAYAITLFTAAVRF